MNDVEIVIFNDKAWVRLAEYQEQIEKRQCCGNCIHRNADEVVETCRKLKKYTLIKGSCECWELAE